MPTGGAIKSVVRISAGELEQNGGRWKLQGGAAIPVHGHRDAAAIGTRPVEGGDALPVYIVSAAQLKQNGGRWPLQAGQPLRVTEIVGTARGVTAGAAVPVYVVNPADWP